MYAIVEIGGQQYKVQEGQDLYVDRVNEKEGKKLELDHVLMVGGNGKVQVGSPTVSKAKVTFKVAEHLKDKKVVVFKKKPKKGYQKQSGHRQLLTKLTVDKIKGPGKKSSSKKKSKKSSSKKSAKSSSSKKKKAKKKSKKGKSSSNKSKKSKSKKSGKSKKS